MSLSAIFFLCLVIGGILVLYHTNRTKWILAKKDIAKLRTEQTALKNAKISAELEKYRVENENKRNIRLNERMSARIKDLETESVHLKHLLEEAELSAPLYEIIKDRVEVLNGLLAAKITNNPMHSKPYNEWLDKLTADKSKFIDSTRKAFEASYPAFITKLRQCGLSDLELDFICLFALGLNGKEIGGYINIKRHYHICSGIRKKLGLKDDDTNLGNYVRNQLGKFQTHL